MLTSDYNDVDKKNNFKIEEKKAYWSAIEKPINDLENKINIWLKEKRKIIIYGTYDHTETLIKNIHNFKNLNIVGFIPYNNINDDRNVSKVSKLPFVQLKDLNEKYDKKTIILISSYEFAYDIEKELKSNFSLLEYYKMYTGYSRNISYYFKNKKN